jgi:hypothetical protein
LEGLEWDFKIYDVAGSGLDRVVVKNCVLVWSATEFGVEIKLKRTMASTLLLFSFQLSNYTRRTPTPKLVFPVPVLW